MKIRVAFLSLLAVSTSFVVSAQVEHDDMYFKSKDRAKLQASRPMTLKSMASAHEVATAINPTDSYSARNVNPEYISQSKVGTGSSESAPYFIPDYTPTSVNQSLSTNNASYWNNYNMAMGGYNPYYYGGMYSAFASPYSSFYSPMYGYNPYGYGYNSYFNSGWSSSLMLGFGMGNYYPSWGSPYWNNYYGWNSFYNNMGYGYYPGNVIIINNDYNGRNAVYGKRTSRSSDLNNYVNPNNRSTAMMTTTDLQGRVRGAAGGRVSSDEGSGSYYQRGWRTNPETSSTTTRSIWGGSGSRTGSGSDNTGFGANSGYNSRSNSSSFFDNGGSRSSWGGGSSNSNFSSGGGSRSSGSVSGGSSGARRGRD